MGRRARFLTTRSQIRWLLGSSLVAWFQVVESNVLQRRSRQCPHGYEVCRVEAEILELWDYMGPRYSEGDDGYEDQGYHNEWEWLEPDDGSMLYQGDGYLNNTKVVGIYHKPGVEAQAGISHMNSPPRELVVQHGRCGRYNYVLVEPFWIGGDGGDGDADGDDGDDGDDAEDNINSRSSGDIKE